MTTFTKLFRSPYSVPNGLQWTAEGLWIADQITDRVALVEFGEPNAYGVTKLIREITTESSNTSGMAIQGESLWLAANGSAHLWRPERLHDAQPGMGDILQVDAASGSTMARHALPSINSGNGEPTGESRGGTHGIERDPFDPEILWLTTLKSQTLTQVHAPSWETLKSLPLPYERAHGVVRVPDGIWVVHTGDRMIVKLDVESGKELERIAVPIEQPEPHGLSILGDAVDNPSDHRKLLYCDATSGWIVQVEVGS